MAGKRHKKGRDVQQARQAGSVQGTKSQGITPPLQQVYAAVELGHINHEEAANLNPNYNPNKIYGIDPKVRALKATQHRQYGQFQFAARGFTPSFSDVALALKGGHITEEEAANLNPEFVARHKNPDGTITTSSKVISRKTSKTALEPRPRDVFKAVHEGHITEDDARELYPTYDDVKKKGLAGLGGTPYRAKRDLYGREPKLHDVVTAYIENHITAEEASELHPKFDASNTRQMTVARSRNKRQALAESGEGKTPALSDLHLAVVSGHLEDEEASNLNPSYQAGSGQQRIDALHNAKRAAKKSTTNEVGQN